MSGAEREGLKQEARRDTGAQAGQKGGAGRQTPPGQGGGTGRQTPPEQGSGAGRQTPPGIWRQQVQRQLQQQRAVNTGLAVAVILLGGLLTVSLIWLGSLYQRLDRVEELAQQTARERREPAEESDEKETRQAEYFASPGDRTSSTLQTEQEDYPELWGLEQVEKPMRRTERQIRERLKELAKEGGILEEIYQNRALYPEKLLEALANNPEMAGFVSEYLNREKREPVLSEKEKKAAFPLFLQWDPRWGYRDYGDNGMIGLSGCGPTCVSMGLYYLTKDEMITPDVIAEYSMENDYYVSGVGTAWALVEAAAEQYGVRSRQLRINEESLLESLEQGGVLICSMSKGDFTAAGHFIVIYGADEEGFLVNDPNCVARSRRHWTWEELQGQIKNVWEYSAVAEM